jgi:Catalytic LigB subunit of aromatic ring-opening dioxygenase
VGQILGLGITHYPPLSYKGNLTRRIKLLLEDPLLPEDLRSPAGWHPTMREQWGTDEGWTHSEQHRHDLIYHFRRIRAELDAFEPDFVLLWGDDQYENYREDCVPPFSVLAYDSVDVQPWKEHGGENWWDEPPDKTFAIAGHRAGAKHLVSALLADGIDVAYSYKPLHHPLGHAFVNSILYLDIDRKGFPYPVVPFTVNAYGRWLVAAQGAPMTPSQAAKLVGRTDLDPPGPQPWRCFQVGRAVARALSQSPWRVAVIASSSWSHSFLVAKHSLMFPDVDSDKRYYAALRDGDWATWGNTTIEEAEDRGHHELLNWFCLAGAMAELQRKPDESVFLESWISNSDKVFAVFRP